MANIVTRGGQQAPLARHFGEFDPFERMRELMAWDPFQALPRRWFGEESTPQYIPRFDVKEEKDAFVIKADLPGMKEEDLDISVTGNHLTISGKREAEEVKESDTYYFRERMSGSFARSFTLPDNVSSDQIQANMQNGVLGLSIPKSAESKPKRIQLKSGNGNGGEDQKSHS
jgi:HSP20 family protein